MHAVVLYGLRCACRSTWLCVLQPLTEVTETATCLPGLASITGPTVMQIDSDILPDSVNGLVSTWLQRLQGAAAATSVPGKAEKI